MSARIASMLVAMASRGLLSVVRMVMPFPTWLAARVMSATLGPGGSQLPEEVRRGTLIHLDRQWSSIDGCSAARPGDGFECRTLTGMVERLQRSGRRRDRPIAVVVDLARVHSTYASETEKALADLFDEAERKGWTLVLDEADELFDRRTEANPAHDRYADLDTNWLLSRLDGLQASHMRGGASAEPLLKGFSVRHFPPD